jgi:hypothetical protein
MHIKIVLHIAETSHMMIVMDLRQVSVMAKHVSSDDGVFKAQSLERYVWQMLSGRC